MRDDGLDRAIDAAGGIAQLARKIGISQPSVSNWTRVPAQRVIAVETATGVPRTDLRPDLYDEQVGSAELIDPIDAARAREYALLAALLSAPPSKRLLDQLAALTGDATPLGHAHAALADAATTAVAVQVEREYFELFVPEDTFQLPMKQSLRDMMDADGNIHVPEGPGLGIDIDWDLVEDSCTSKRIFRA